MPLMIENYESFALNLVHHPLAGAGIVFDSNPQEEWEETMTEGRAVAEAAKGL